MGDKVKIVTGKKGRPPQVDAELAAEVQKLVSDGVSFKDALAKVKAARAA